MTLHEQAAAMDQGAIVALLESKAELQRQVDGFKRQLFGSKSERRILEESPAQLTLGASLIPSRSSTTPAPATPVAGHSRRRRREAASDDQDLRFDASVPVKVIEVPSPEMMTLKPGSYEVVGVKETCRLAQRPGSYVVLRYRRPVIKRKDTGEFHCPPAPPAVLEKSVADVSLLAGLLIDKFSYHRVPRRLTFVERPKVRHAARKMRVGPSGSGCRSGSQTAPSCAGQEPGW